MTVYTLKNGILVDIEEYSDAHAESISRELFSNLDTNVIIQQRRDLLSSGLDEVYSVCSISDDRVTGVCTGVRKRWYGERHRIEMVQVVVRDDFQGLGIARFMMMEIAKHFMKRGVEILQISTETKNLNAIRAYEKIGFRKIGIINRGIRYDDEYSDEVMMAMMADDMVNESPEELIESDSDT